MNRQTVRRAENIGQNDDSNRQENRQVSGRKVSEGRDSRLGGKTGTGTGLDQQKVMKETTVGRGEMALSRKNAVGLVPPFVD